ncbi:unnamed protein product [Symbiodinium natans]|uniref:R3H domain-containing protein n=1 Tax=Symbiodinium natans TaxID=878477 RepID=A0A812GAL7_9DINO|nr:unnamed protein product [Symbiodinium natans]
MTTESFRKNVAKQLSDLQGNPDEDAKIDFPKDLTSADRKYIHKIAESFRLHTLSSGTGNERFISVYKNPPAGAEAKQFREPGSGAAQPLVLSRAGRLLLDKGFGRSSWARLLCSGLQAHAHIRFLQKVLLESGPPPAQAHGADVEPRQLEGLQVALRRQQEELEEARAALKIEAHRAAALERALEAKTQLCEDLAAQHRQESTRSPRRTPARPPPLAMAEAALPCVKDGLCDASTCAPDSEGGGTARSVATAEEEALEGEVIEAFMSQLRVSEPGYPDAAPQTETKAVSALRRQRARCQQLNGQLKGLAQELLRLEPESLVAARLSPRP